MEADKKVVGLMADPGVPARVAAEVADAVRLELTESPDDAEWHVESSQETLSLTPDGDMALMGEAEELRSRYGWDYIVYLTDLPRYHDREPLLCEASGARRAALVSIPAMGAWGSLAKVRSLLVALVRSAKIGAPPDALVESIREIGGLTRARESGQGRGDVARIVLPGWSSRFRLLTGMVRSNRPGRMLPALSGSLTAAVAAGAFGVYYSSMWMLADALHPARLFLVGLIVIGLLTGWLIFRNGLWNTRREVESPWQGLLDNTTTVLMVGTSVALMYLLIVVGLFGLSLVVIDSSHLQSELMHRVTLVEYGKLTWLAASLGTLFGALGGNFDSDEAIREATYSQTEHARRQRRNVYDD